MCVGETRSLRYSTQGEGVHTYVGLSNWNFHNWTHVEDKLFNANKFLPDIGKIRYPFELNSY